jgi:hypothetical protein
LLEAAGEMRLRGEAAGGCHLGPRALPSKNLLFVSNKEQTRDAARATDDSCRAVDKKSDIAPHLVETIGPKRRVDRHFQSKRLNTE